MQHPGARLRALVEQDVVMIPGAFNALVGMAVREAGFDACYISGGATANVAGTPDVGLLTLTEVVRTVREIADASGIPVIADADTGYGEVECAVRTVVEYERAGAAALHVEDQVFPKRCGHLDGKQLVPAEEFCEKISAMADARKDPGFMIIARTDARHVAGMEDAIDRGNRYREAGADAIFPEGLQSEAEFQTFATGSPGLLLANMTEFGKTPIITAERFGELGYRMVIYPLSMMRLAMGEVVRGLSELRRSGSVEPILDRMQSRQELYDLLGYTPGTEWRFPRGGE
ncbi:MAG: isocitrate lyase/phosphoenolpyruvate mutase family protein [Planctomycetota bacterium]|jgi:methylisocitrate lyase|nr:isocitrate lyase/phosphoenolpyruvate mutase family protein [Planctomycetota bacterium]MDA1027232.1 isocitrate lyase/phosphoenolpyruvate mutase family protein [Planctomycetota bacterium]